MSMKLSDIAVLNIKIADYCCVIRRISKTEAINLIAKYWLDRKNWNILKYNNLLFLNLFLI